MMRTEYAIWGRPPGATEEALLLTNPGGGEPITDKAAAERYLATLRDNHGCTHLRIQTIEFDADKVANAFRNVVN